MRSVLIPYCLEKKRFDEEMARRKQLKEEELAISDPATERLIK
jgi:hypothetical protein